MKQDWFDLWFKDMECIIETMVRNLQSDLEAGYNPHGHCVALQRVEIDSKRNAFDRQLEAFKKMDDAQVQRWCYYDLKKRGAIS